MKNNLPEDVKIFTNISAILYYSGNVKQDLNQQRVSLNNIEEILISAEANTYVALKIDEDDGKENSWLDTWKGNKPIKEFSNTNGDRIVIFATAKTRNLSRK